MRSPKLTLGMVLLATAACSQPTNHHQPESAEVSKDLPRLVRFSVRSESALQALVRGRLHIDPQGCLRIGGDPGPFVIWHHDSRIERSSEGRIRVTDGNTGNGAYVGDEIAMGGGRTSEAPTSVSEPIPEDCKKHGFWIAGQLMTEAERQRMLERERSLGPVPSPS